MDTRSHEPNEEQAAGHTLAVCSRDDYCVDPALNRCPCCELMYCDKHFAAEGLCLDCQDWCARQEAS